MRLVTTAAGAIGVVALAACTRARDVSSDASSSSRAAPEASAASGPDAARVVLDPPLGDVPITWLEARRARLANLDDEPALAKNDAAIRAHFGGALPIAMRLQAIPLAQGREAFLLDADDGAPRPMALMVDATGAALWTKDHPTAGITPPVTQLALAPRDENGVALFLFDEPTHLVAVRMWDSQGYPFANLQMFTLPRCDALSAARWPGRGWIVVATHAGSMRAQLLKDDGTTAWGKTGIDVGEPWRAGPAPATIAIDGAGAGDDGWLLLQYATRGGANHVLASHFNPFGNATWPAPKDLGAVDRPDAGARVEASHEGPGATLVTVGDRAIRLRPTGDTPPPRR